MFVKHLIKRGGAAPPSLRRAGVLFAILLAIFSTVEAQQSNAADPDYSGVKDILQGRRTLLSINDLIIGGTVLKTSGSTQIEDKNISELPNFQRSRQNPEILARMFDSKPEVLVVCAQFHGVRNRSELAKHNICAFVWRVQSYRYRLWRLPGRRTSGGRYRYFGQCTRGECSGSQRLF